jgi:type II secretory pathway predicted ATPase ExeA
MILSDVHGARALRGRCTGLATPVLEEWILMYCDFFGLRSRPFENRADTQFLYMTPLFEETLAAMEYETRHERGVALVIGEAGTGKTLLTRSLLQRLDAQDRVVVLTWPAREQISLIREAAKGFGVSLPPSHHSRRLLGRLRRHLTRTSRVEHRPILIVDQAENLTGDNIAQLASLIDLHDEDQRLLSILLVGQPHVRSLLSEPAHATVAQQLFGERVLRALTPEQTGAYIRHRMRTAGATGADVFDGGAVMAIHEASHGIPRLINRIANAALVAAYGGDDKRVTRTMINELTATSGPLTRTVKVGDLGLSDVDQVAARLAGRGAPGSDLAVDVGETAETTTALPVKPPEGTACPDRSEAESASAVCARHDVHTRADEHKDWTMEWCAGVESSVVERGEGLMVRLERALARAERVNATTDGSMARFAVVEKRLAALMTGAERLVTQLSRAAQQSTTSLEQVQRRADQVAAQAEERFRAVERGTQHAIEVSDRTELQVERVARACEHAKDVESRIQAFAEQLADKVDEVQERASLLMKGLDAGETSQEKLARLIETASRLTEDPDRALAPLEARTRELLEKAATQVERLDEAVASSAGRADEQLQAKTREIVEQARVQIGRLGQAAASFTARTNEQIGEMRSAFEDTRCEARKFQEKFTNAVLRECREGPEERPEVHLPGQQGALDVAMKEQHATLREPLERSGAQSRAIDDTTSATGERIDEQRRQMDELEQRLRAAEAVLTSLPARVADAATQLESLDDTGHGMARSVTELTARAETAQAQLAETVPPVETLLREAQSACGRIEAVLQNAGRVLGDIGGACERAQTLRDQVGPCHDLLRRLDTSHEEARAAAVALDEATAAARPLAETLGALTVKAADRNRELDTQESLAGKLIDRLASATNEGRALSERIEAQTNDTVQMAAQVQEQTGALDDSRAVGERVGAQLCDLIQSGQQLHDAMQGLVAHADEKVGQLDSHHAGATHTLGDLTHAIRAGHEIVGQVNASIGRVEEASTTAAEQTDRLNGVSAMGQKLLNRIEEAKSTLGVLTESAAAQIGQLKTDAAEATAQAQASIADLHEQRTSVEALTGTLDQAKAAAGETVSNLAQETDRAEAQIGTMAQRCKEVAGLTERLRAVSRLVEAAKQIEGSIKSTTEAAHVMRDQLVEASGAAGEQNATLERTGARAKELVAVCERTTADAASAVQRLTTQLTAARDAIEAGQPMINEYVTQAGQLERNIEALQDQVGTIEQVLTAAMAKPAQLVTEAQSQAAQLERVCAAVRKVFSGLSQSSLEVRKHSAECAQATRQADERLAQLTEQTDRTGRLLQEWVEEAVHAQARLERTLKQCPTIYETHPVTPKTRTARGAGISERIANRSAGGELAELSTPPNTEPELPPPSREPTGRSQEVSQLIEEARRAVSTAKV